MIFFIFKRTTAALTFLDAGPIEQEKK